MRTLDDHKVSGLNEALDITVLDSPGAGGANHQYQISDVSRQNIGDDRVLADIFFQNGPINEHGVNGLSGEALITVLIDRMRGFQYARNPVDTFDTDTAGKYACEENKQALIHLEAALAWLQKRTKDRLARGVEGTHKK